MSDARAKLATLERGLATAMNALELNPLQRLGIAALVRTFGALITDLIEEIDKLKNGGSSP